MCGLIFLQAALLDDVFSLRRGGTCKKAARRERPSILQPPPPPVAQLKSTLWEGGKRVVFKTATPTVL